MLLLLFYVGDQTYAINSDFIMEVLPSVNLKQISYVPSYVAGLLNFGGQHVPVIDFSHLLIQKPSSHSFHTRIILISLFKSEEKPALLGLKAEKVIEIFDTENDQIASSLFKGDAHSFFGGIVNRENQVIQVVEGDRFFLAMEKKLFKNYAAFESDSNSKSKNGP